MKARDIFYSLALKVDPKIKASGATFTKASVGYNDGSRYSAQQLLDIYNEARFTLVHALKSSLTDGVFSKEMALAIKLADLSFSYDYGGYAFTNCPSDLLEFVSITDYNGKTAMILPNSLLPAVKSGTNPHFVNNETQIYLFRQGRRLAYFGNNINIDYPYHSAYIGLSALDLDTDIKGGATDEIFFDDSIPTLLQIAEAIANEQGAVEVNGLARMLIAQKGGR